MISDSSHHSVSESYRTLRTGIMLSSAVERRLQVLLITSATPNEGKTTTAANLAVAMAQMGEKVLLVDGDMRRHNLHSVFDVENSVGISDAIIDPEKLALAIKEVPLVPNLSLIPGGTLAPNPSELLGSVRMKSLLSGLREKFDRIILDSPPLMVFSDALVLSRLADGVIMVIWGGMTSRDVVKKAGLSLSGVQAKTLGVVLNNISLSEKNSYYYYYPYYSYYYGNNGSGKKRRKSAKRTHHEETVAKDSQN